MVVSSASSAFQYKQNPRKLHNVEEHYSCIHCGSVMLYESSSKSVSKCFDAKHFTPSDVFQRGTALCNISQNEMHKPSFDTYQGKKEFKCLYCDKFFSFKSLLKIHLRVHTGEKPFQCDLCEKAFAQQGNLKKHYLTHSS